MNPRVAAWTQGLRFLSTGLLNTAFGYAIYALLLAGGLGYLPALAVATGIGVVFNYHSYGRLVFRGKGGALAFGRFIVAYAITYVFNALLLQQIVQSGLAGPFLAQVLCLPAAVGLSWLLLNRWVYARRKDPPS